MKTITLVRFITLILVFGQLSWAQQTEREVCGDAKKTADHHDERCHAGCDCPGDGKFCFTETQLEVKTPSDKWVFSGPPRIDCMYDDQGSCAWNNLGAKDRFWVTLNNPTEIHANVATGSRSITIRICAKAQYYP